jgi:hypothetical protein
MKATSLRNDLMDYRMQVNVSGDKDEDTWSGNALLFPTPEAAEEYARDLFMRWTQVKFWRVVDENGWCHATNKEK